MSQQSTYTFIGKSTESVTEAISICCHTVKVCNKYSYYNQTSVGMFSDNTFVRIFLPPLEYKFSPSGFNAQFHPIKILYFMIVLFSLLANVLDFGTYLRPVIAGFVSYLIVRKANKRRHRQWSTETYLLALIWQNDDTLKHHLWWDPCVNSSSNDLIALSDPCSRSCHATRLSNIALTNLLHILHL